MIRREYEVRKNGILVATTNGNWNYYLYGKAMYYISNNEDCYDGWFGDTEHFKKVYRRNKEYYSLTSKGEEIIGIEKSIVNQ